VTSFLVYAFLRLKLPFSTIKVKHPVTYRTGCGMIDTAKADSHTKRQLIHNTTPRCFWLGLSFGVMLLDSISRQLASCRWFRHAIDGFATPPNRFY
jgi:hypothetical protein